MDKTQSTITPIALEAGKCSMIMFPENNRYNEQLGSLYYKLCSQTLIESWLHNWLYDQEQVT